MPGWTAPRTWSIGEFATKAILDTHIRDNSLSLHNMMILRRTTAVAGTAAWFGITWEVEDLDEPGMWAGGAPTRLTAAVTGRFEVHVIGAWTGQTGTGINGLRVIRYNSASVEQEKWGANHTEFANESLSVYGMGQMTSTDFLVVEQYSGWSGTVGSGVFRVVLVQRG